MTDKTGNHKIRPPKLAITRKMIEGGKSKLDELTAMALDEDAANDEPAARESYKNIK